MHLLLIDANECQDEAGTTHVGPMSRMSDPCLQRHLRVSIATAFDSSILRWIPLSTSPLSRLQYHPRPYERDLASGKVGTTPSQKRLMVLASTPRVGWRRTRRTPEL